MLFNPDNDIYFNINSTKQIQEFLFNFLKLKPLKDKNEKGNYSVAEDILVEYAEKHDVRFCQLLLNYRKLLKARNTYVKGIRKKITDKGLIHPSFLMHSTETYRSSSRDPNFHNFPKHGYIIDGLPWKSIRNLFMAKGDGWLVGEVDYVAAEVKVCAMLTDDDQLIDDTNNDYDQHSHWANVLFELNLPLPEVKKQYGETYRFLAKNNFTFANLFGASYRSMAENMRKQELYVAFVKEKHWNKLVNKRGSFNDYLILFSEENIQNCQEAFYNRYPKVKIWQETIVNLFRENGYVENPFGFRRRHPLQPNDVINFPIQSTSFLILLDSLCDADDYLVENNFESNIVGQIHDSGYFNLKVEEAYDVMEIVKHYMTNRPYKWSKRVNLEADWEIGKCWNKMKGVKLAA